MSDQEFAQLMLMIDGIWAQNDKLYWTGFRLLIGEKPYTLAEAAVRELAEGVDRPTGELKWMPKPPEVLARVRRIENRLAVQERSRQRLAGLLEADRQRELAPALSEVESSILELLPRNRSVKFAAVRLAATNAGVDESVVVTVLADLWNRGIAYWDGIGWSRVDSTAEVVVR